jgi:hypothetical protein
MLSFLSSVIKKELSGKSLPIPPVNIRRHSRRKLLTSVSGNSTAVLSLPTTENGNIDVKLHKHKKKLFKDFEAHDSWISVPLSNNGESDEERRPEMETLTDNDNHNKQSDDSMTYCEEGVKDKFGLEEDVKLPDSKVDCEEVETEVKLERKRKPMVIASHITVAQGTIIMGLKKAKAVPLHTTEALGGRGCIAPTHSRPLH